MEHDRPDNESCRISGCQAIAETFWQYPEPQGRVAVCGLHAAALRAFEGSK